MRYTFKPLYKGFGYLAVPRQNESRCIDKFSKQQEAADEASHSEADTAED